MVTVRSGARKALTFGSPASLREKWTGPRGMVAFRPTEISDVELEALAKWLNASKADPKEKGE